MLVATRSLHLLFHLNAIHLHIARRILTIEAIVKLLLVLRTRTASHAQIIEADLALVRLSSDASGQHMRILL